MQWEKFRKQEDEEIVEIVKLLHDNGRHYVAKPVKDTLVTLG